MPPFCYQHLPAKLWGTMRVQPQLATAVEFRGAGGATCSSMDTVTESESATEAGTPDLISPAPFQLTHPVPERIWVQV